MLVCMFVSLFRRLFALISHKPLVRISPYFLYMCPMWARGNPPCLFTSPPSTPCLSVSFTFPLSYSLHLFSCFSIPSHYARIVLLCFQAGCRRRRLNLALVFVCADLARKGTSWVYSSGQISPRWVEGMGTGVWVFNGKICHVATVFADHSVIWPSTVHHGSSVIS